MSDIFIASNKYGKYAIPVEVKQNARYDVKQILKGQIHEPDTIKFMLTKCGGGIIVHAGAFYGDFLPALGSLPNKVYAFEPYKRYFDCAEKTLKLNYPDGNHNVHLVNMGLGEKGYSKNLLHSDINGKPLGGEALLSYDDESKVHVFAKRNEFDGTINESMVEEVEIVRLDDFLPEDEKTKVSILQYDLEGYEEKALIGSIETIEKSQPTLIIECWRDPSDKRQIPEVLRTDFFNEEIFGKGYIVAGTLHHNIVLKRN